MKKKLISVLLCMTMGVTMLATAGCSSKSENADESTKAESSADGKTTLTFWCHENEPWVKSYEAIAEKFEEANPEYHVEVQPYPFKVYNEKIQTALTGGSEGPDVIAVWGGTAPSFIESDALSEVPENLVSELESDYLEPTLGIYQKEGKYYGVPMEFNLEYGGMVVNKKMFEEANVSYPETWAELREVSKKVAKKKGDIVNPKGFEMIDSDALICNYLAMILQQGGSYIEKDNSVNFATPEGIKAMEEILSIVKDGETDLSQLTSGEYGYNEVYQDKAYMSSVGTWAIGEGTSEEGYNLKYGEDFEYIPVPQYGDEMAFASETGWGIIVPKNSEKQEGAWKFVEFFSQPENLVQHNIACNQLPARKSLLDSKEYREAMPNITFILDILPYGKWMGPYNTSTMREILDDMFINLCDEENPDVEAALKEASKKITDECQISYSIK